MQLSLEIQLPSSGTKWITAPQILRVPILKSKHVSYFFCRIRSIHCFLFSELSANKFVDGCVCESLAVFNGLCFMVLASG